MYSGERHNSRVQSRRWQRRQRRPVASSQSLRSPLSPSSWIIVPVERSPCVQLVHLALEGAAWRAARGWCHAAGITASRPRASSSPSRLLCACSALLFSLAGLLRAPNARSGAARPLPSVLIGSASLPRLHPACLAALGVEGGALEYPRTGPSVECSAPCPKVRLRGRGGAGYQGGGQLARLGSRGWKRPGLPSTPARWLPGPALPEQHRGVPGPAFTPGAGAGGARSSVAGGGGPGSTAPRLAVSADAQGPWRAPQACRAKEHRQHGRGARCGLWRH